MSIPEHMDKLEDELHESIATLRARLRAAEDTVLLLVAERGGTIDLSIERVDEVMRALENLGEQCELTLHVDETGFHYNIKGL